MDKNKTIDGIKPLKITKRLRIEPYTFFVEATAKKNSKPLHKSIFNFNLLNLWFAKTFNFPILLSIFLIIFAFVFGAYVTWKTDKTLADSSESFGLVLGTNLKVINTPFIQNETQNISNKILFNLTLEQLEAYFTEVLKTPEMKEADLLADRKFKLKIYLDNKKSPLIDIVDTLAELKHWKMVLAISNSESTLGKRCYNNNCSGIGVEPGHPLWREYNTKADWAKDLDRLIEKRYKDWTLEEMNGVYNQPGSKNWLSASRQILEELRDFKIQ